MRAMCSSLTSSAASQQNWANEASHTGNSGKGGRSGAVPSEQLMSPLNSADVLPAASCSSAMTACFLLIMRFSTITTADSSQKAQTGKNR